MNDPAPGGQGATKLEIAKRETIRTIQGFPATTYFNLILIGCEKDGTFKRDRMLWKKSLQAATPRAKSDAESFIDRQEGGGQTNLWDMVEIAFEDEAADSFFLYTDGAVNRGTFMATEDIFVDLKRLNRYRKIMIHTVEMAAAKPNTADNIRLLKGLAERTKGQYRLAE
jgi:hypothetical protein